MHRVIGLDGEGSRPLVYVVRPEEDMDDVRSTTGYRKIRRERIAGAGDRDSVMYSPNSPTLLMKTGAPP